MSATSRSSAAEKNPEDNSEARLIKSIKERDLPLFEPGEAILGKNGSYRVSRLLGAGAFGTVCKIYDQNENAFALKSEGIHSKKDGVEGRLKIEALVMKCISSQSICKRHLLELCDFGLISTNKRKYRFIVIPFVGPSLEKVRKEFTPNDKFSTSTSMQILYQLLQALRDLHDLGFLHRDVKLPNCAIGYGMNNATRIYLLDYGTARYFRSQTGQVRMPRAVPTIAGSKVYMSLNCLQGREVGRKDDLESWFYVALELLAPELFSEKALDKMAAADLTKIKRDLVDKGLLLTKKLAFVPRENRMHEKEKNKKKAKEAEDASKSGASDSNKSAANTTLTNFEKKLAAREEAKKLYANVPSPLFIILRKIVSLRYFDRPDYSDLMMILHMRDHTKDYTMKDPLDWMSGEYVHKLEDYFTKKYREKDIEIKPIYANSNPDVNGKVKNDEEEAKKKKKEEKKEKEEKEKKEKEASASEASAMTDTTNTGGKSVKSTMMS